MATASDTLAPRGADLANPLYYLENMETVVGWVLAHHGDLLTLAERRRLDAFRVLPEPARALLTRLVMRTGELFRADKLAYPELPVADALACLADGGWLRTDPELALADLFRLYTLAELRQAFAPLLASLGLPRSLPKRELQARLSPEMSVPNPLKRWPGALPGPVVQLTDMALFERVRLMFFGNLRQGWADFVLVELGHQQYERVPFTPASRAFQCRDHVDRYLVLHQCREQLDAGVEPGAVWPQVPEASGNPWLDRRRDRLLLELGRLADRGGDRDLALRAYAASGHPEAHLKRLRLLERDGRIEDAWRLLATLPESDAGDDPSGQGEAEAEGLARLRRRLARKLNLPAPPPAPRPTIREWTLTLPGPTGPVEAAVARHLHRDDAPVAYVENCLIPGLFGLLCWPAVFEPLPGAFFHPFHAAPADLAWPDFVARRQAGFATCLARLRTDDYRTDILDTWDAKYGLANPFVAWSELSRPLLERALACIPAGHLEAMFRRLLQDVRGHRSGFPDLIRFRPAARSGSRYELIEVKGPGDRLQDHQRRWLVYFAHQGIPASVCYLRWHAPESAP